MAWTRTACPWRTVGTGWWRHPRTAPATSATSTSAEVASFTTIKSPIATPGLFFARDADALAPTTRMTVNLLQAATVSWKLVDTAGNVAAVHLDQVAKPAGTLAWVWDGKTDSGSWAHDGLYWSVVTATTDAGTYSHKFAVYQSAFKLYTTTKSASGGSRVTFTITTAEPLSKAPTVTVTQPGLASYKITTTTHGQHPLPRLHHVQDRAPRRHIDPRLRLRHERERPELHVRIRCQVGRAPLAADAAGRGGLRR